jgi:hypothetical protein
MRSTVTLQFGSNFAVWLWTLPDILAKYLVSELDSFFIIHNFIFQVLHYEFIRLAKVPPRKLFTITQLVVCWHIVRAAWVRFPLILFLFKCHVFHGFGGHYFSLIFSNFALFSFRCSFILKKWEELVLASQCVKLKIRQHLVTVKVYTLSE